MTNLETPGKSEGFIRLGALLLQAPMDCIIGGAHLFRQGIKQAKAEQRMKYQRNLTGRQVLWVVHRVVAINEIDKAVTDFPRLQRIALQNGDIQQIIFHWVGMLSVMAKRHTGEHLVSLFVFQFGARLSKAHEFYVDHFL